MAFLVVPFFMKKFNSSTQKPKPIYSFANKKMILELSKMKFDDIFDLCNLKMRFNV